MKIFQTSISSKKDIQKKFDSQALQPYSKWNEGLTGSNIFKKAERMFNKYSSHLELIAFLLDNILSSWNSIIKFSCLYFILTKNRFKNEAFTINSTRFSFADV